MKTYNLLLFIALVCVMSACRKDTPELYNPNEDKIFTRPSQIFTTFWHGMNNSYAFWDVDPTDWDKVYDEYLPRFKALDSQKEISTYQLQTMYMEMTKNLIDHHLIFSIININAHKDSSNMITIDPAQYEVEKRDYYHPNIMDIDALVIPIRENQKNGRITSLAGGESVVKGNTMVSYSYNIDNSVAYIYLSSFLITDVYNNSNSPENEAVIKAINNFQSMIMDMPNLKGVIVDVRSNNGGSANDINFIVAPMLSEELNFGYYKTKNGLGRLDYTPWIPYVVSPAKKHRKVEVPIVVLADLYSISMPEIIAMAILELPNGYMVGERTYGGTSSVRTTYSYNYGGSFENNAMSVYMANSISKRADGTIVEGVGVTPDVEVLYDEQSMRNGVDKQLERALQLIEEKSSVK